VTYLRLLDAQWDRADWQELAIDPAILHIDLVREPIRPRRAWAPGARPLADGERLPHLLRDGAHTELRFAAELATPVAGRLTTDSLLLSRSGDGRDRNRSPPVH